MPGVDGLDWDGRGLPPAAQARLQRPPPTGSRLLPDRSVALGCRRTGFEPVGEAMGCIVMHLGWSGYGCPGCTAAMAGRWLGSRLRRPAVTVDPADSGAWHARPGGFGRRDSAVAVTAVRCRAGSPTVTSGAPARPVGRRQWSGYRALRRRDLPRLRHRAGPDECGSAGARRGRGGRGPAHDGADGGRLPRVRRARNGGPVKGATHLARPFDTLLAAWTSPSCWPPAGRRPARSSACRSRCGTTTTAPRCSGPAGRVRNVEVAGYTELVTAARADARDQFGRRVAHTGAEGAVVDAITPARPRGRAGEGHRDHVAEAMVHGHGDHPLPRATDGADPEPGLPAADRSALHHSRSRSPNRR